MVEVQITEATPDPTPLNAPDPGEEVRVPRERLVDAAAHLLTSLEPGVEEDLNLLASKEVEPVFINFTLAHIPTNRDVAPISIPLPHPLYVAPSSSSDWPGVDVCVIVKDPQRPWKDELLEESNQDAPVKKVIGVTKLKNNYSTFQLRRQLLGQYDCFLCDKRVVHLTPKLLGKEFIAAKKLPVPIRLQSGEAKKQVESALKCTWFTVRSGPTLTVKMARGGMTSQQVADNAQCVIAAVDKLLRGVKYSNRIQAIHLTAANRRPLRVFVSPIVADQIRAKQAAIQSARKAALKLLNRQVSEKTKRKKRQLQQENATSTPDEREVATKKVKREKSSTTLKSESREARKSKLLVQEKEEKKEVKEKKKTRRHAI